MKLLTPLLLASLGLYACGDSGRTPTRYTLQFEAIDDRGDPIEGMAVAIGNTKIGLTNSEGVLRAQVNATDGDRFPLHTECPETHKEFDVPSHVVFRNMRGLTGEENANIQMRLECERTERVGALLVAGSHPGMPILIDGVPQGTTGPGGFAHLRVDLPPDAQFQVALDSSAFPNLRPINPSLKVALGNQDDFFVFEPSFTEAEKPKKKRRRSRRKKKEEEPERTRPVRID